MIDSFKAGVGHNVVVMDEDMAKSAAATTMNKDVHAFISARKD